MTNYKITKNGKEIKSGMSKEEAIDKLFTTVEDFTDSNYVYDSEDETIKSPSGQIIAEKGDEYVVAGEYSFAIEIEEDEDDTENDEFLNFYK